MSSINDCRTAPIPRMGKAYHFEKVLIEEEGFELNQHKMTRRDGDYYAYTVVHIDCPHMRRYLYKKEYSFRTILENVDWCFACNRRFPERLRVWRRLLITGDYYES